MASESVPPSGDPSSDASPAGARPGPSEDRPPAAEAPTASAPATLEQEAAAAPESAWFFAWVKSALLYLAVVTSYLGAVLGLVADWKKLKPGEGQSANLTIYVLAGILLLPLLFALLFNLLPALRRRRERSLRTRGPGAAGYFTTAPRDADPHGFFAHGYEPFLEWAAAPKAPLLHLSGLSGSGKSSLLSAYLAPRLSDAHTRLLIVRSYTDPLLALKETLLPLWKEKPAGYDELAPLEALRRAARRLGHGERLLVAFDQFEEFFLLRATPARLSGQPASAAAPVPTVGQADLAPLRDFLQAFLKDPPPGVTLLLSYREDHRRLLAPLGLPSRHERVNHLVVEPLDFAAAEDFLRSCPKLDVPAERMDRVLREAARQEGGRVVMRPIVANLLGLILRQMSAHPTLWRRKDDLLRGYVRDTLGTELAESRSRLLRALLTDFHTTRPRTLAELSTATDLPEPDLETELETLEHAGLLRQLHTSAGAGAPRTWQIAHDFLATLIERVLDSLHRTLWRTLRPWLAPAAAVIALCTFVVWPAVEKQLAINELREAGFLWTTPDSQVAVVNYKGRFIKDLSVISRQIHVLKPLTLNLSDCAALKNADGLTGLTNLKTLQLRDCWSLKNVDGLTGLPNLQTLDLSDCKSLQNVDVLTGLPNLQTLDLSYCKSLQNVDVLTGLPNLQALGLKDCRRLKSVERLTGLINLQTLDLGDCGALQNVAGLTGLINLHNLYLGGCGALQNVDGLTGLTNLRTLSLRYGTALQNVDGLTGLTNLQYLDLGFCDPLQNVDALKGLTNLQDLILVSCTALQNVSGLTGLTNLTRLDLERCLKVPPEIWPSLKTALPKASIRFPDKTTAGPPYNWGD